MDEVFKEIQMNELEQQSKRVKDLQATLERERFLNRPSVHEKII